MFITLGSFYGAIGSTDQFEGTFMHELGHNFNLYHGGAYPSANPSDDSYDNCKPNYLSVMSYSRQFSIWDTSRSLNYSNGQYGNLQLSESSQLQEFPPYLQKSNQNPLQKIIYGFHNPLTHTNGANIAAVTSGNSIDWGVDNSQLSLNEMTPIGVQDNVNNLGITGCDVASGSTSITKLNDTNDWGNLLLNFRGASSFYDGAPLIAASPDGQPAPDPAPHGSVRYGACVQMDGNDDKRLHDGLINIPTDNVDDVKAKGLLHKPTCFVQTGGAGFIGTNITDFNIESIIP
jgi:hypothetical protein